MKIITLKDWLDDKLDSIDIKEQCSKFYSFNVRFGCVKMAAPRHERFNDVRDIVSDLIDKVFNCDSIEVEDMVYISQRDTSEIN